MLTRKKSEDQMTLEQQYTRGLIFLHEWLSEELHEVSMLVRYGKMPCETLAIAEHLYRASDRFGHLLAIEWLRKIVNERNEP